DVGRVPLEHGGHIGRDAARVEELAGEVEAAGEVEPGAAGVLVEACAQGGLPYVEVEHRVGRQPVHVEAFPVDVAAGRPLQVGPPQEGVVGEAAREVHQLTEGGLARPDGVPAR